MIKDDVYQLIQNSATLDALNLLINYLYSKNKELYNQAILCKARYINYRRDANKNILVNSEIIISQINNTILSIADEIEGYNYTENSYNHNHQIEPLATTLNNNLNLRVFLSYSHSDEDLKIALDKHLSSLKRTNKISIWNDRKILPGAEWDEEIKRELEDSELILLLISANFNASEYIWHNELLQAIKRHDNKQTKVIPIFCKPCDFIGLPYAKLQGLPKNARPISTFTNIDEPLAEIAVAIRKIIEDISINRIQ
ncbi:TIR domain-containing protein [Spirosoma sp. HMF4905]|uniref:TIR domain-containing protein n=1 Tax=Spirosoma arboris TaxID=2682092 RepID=A0A7K1SQS4_9BACT|nr:TIR domain-containing protein [Spirosoma arboris]MVM36139.1 TIR domain-containing protein [Spirosoma arboris]